MNRFQSITAAALSLLLLTSVTGCADDPAEQPVIPPMSTDGTEPVTLPSTQMIVTTTTEPPVPPDISVSMLAVGDNLVQTCVYNAAKKLSPDGTGYNFAPLYENIKSYVQAADVAVINQETLICGGDYEITGSKLNFNSPVELGDAMVEVGFDVFTTANNHMLDKGIDGLAASLDYWDGMMKKYPILALGAYRNETDQNSIRLQEVKGMRIAYLAYTEHINGYSVPAGSDIKIGLTSDEALIERQIREANQYADAVVVSAHWGVDDTREPDQGMYELAQKMIDWGADVILGSGPHTAETMEYITREDGTRGMVFYSMGNFISAQTDNFNLVGEMEFFDLVKHGDTGETTVEHVRCLPVITHYDDGALSNLRLYPYDMYTNELAVSHGVPYAPLGSAKNFSMDVINQMYDTYVPAQFHYDFAENSESGADAPAETTAPVPDAQTPVTQTSQTVPMG